MTAQSLGKQSHSLSKANTAQGRGLIVLKMPGLVRYQLIQDHQKEALKLSKKLTMIQANGSVGNMLATQPGDLPIILGTTWESQVEGGRESTKLP